MHMRTRHKVVADKLVHELRALKQLGQRHALHVREPLGDGLRAARQWGRFDAWQQGSGGFAALTPPAAATWRASVSACGTPSTHARTQARNACHACIRRRHAHRIRWRKQGAL